MNENCFGLTKVNIDEHCSDFFAVNFEQISNTTLMFSMLKLSIFSISLRKKPGCFMFQVIHFLRLINLFFSKRQTYVES